MSVREGSSATRAPLLVDLGSRAHQVTLRTGLALCPKAAQTLADFPTLSEQGLPEPIVFAAEPAQTDLPLAPVADPVVTIELYTNLGGAAGLGTGRTGA